MGTLGGIGELAKEAFGEGTGKSVQPTRAKVVPSVPGTGA
jgi:hypothetical protein